MRSISGKYTNAIVYTDNLDECAYQQLGDICNHFAFRNSVIRVMPDCHAGNGCVKKRYEVIEAKKDFTFETVLSSHYKLDILRKAKENGYFRIIIPYHG
ncbi:hypothetical protein [uncultured Ruminococcus sp.]|uniref:hypothetical protein n=1 Tax=uncultured Ruminococcus sp. TaxID=165186 RepID=UPI0025FC18B8|nr:hypothetical protein [uncultured Ruminococcus sp.]